MMDNKATLRHRARDNTRKTAIMTIAANKTSITTINITTKVVLRRGTIKMGMSMFQSQSCHAKHANSNLQRETQTPT
jgi:hypothetical protein